MQKKKGISLIVLVITIIVMIVLAGAIILSLNNTGIIEKAKEAVSDTDEATVKELAQLAWAEAYAEGIRHVENKQNADGTEVKGLEARVLEALAANNVVVNKYDILVTEKGVTVISKDKIITFYIDDEEYKAEKGMTWAEWEASIYNTIGMDGFSVMDYDNNTWYILRYYYEDGKYMLAEGIVRDEENKFIESEYKITPDAHYETEEIEIS